MDTAVIDLWQVRAGVRTAQTGPVNMPKSLLMGAKIRGKIRPLLGLELAQNRNFSGVPEKEGGVTSTSGVREKFGVIAPLPNLQRLHRRKNNGHQPAALHCPVDSNRTHDAVQEA